MYIIHPPILSSYYLSFCLSIPLFIQSSIHYVYLLTYPIYPLYLSIFLKQFLPHDDMARRQPYASKVQSTFPNLNKWCPDHPTSRAVKKETSDEFITRLGYFTKKKLSVSTRQRSLTLSHWNLFLFQWIRIAGATVHFLWHTVLCKSFLVRKSTEETEEHTRQNY